MVYYLSAFTRSGCTNGKGTKMREMNDSKQPYIFISYSHQDHFEICAEILEILRNGYAVWHDKEIVDLPITSFTVEKCIQERPVRIFGYDDLLLDDKHFLSVPGEDVIEFFRRASALDKIGISQKLTLPKEAPIQSKGVFRATDLENNKEEKCISGRNRDGMHFFVWREVRDGTFK